MTDRVGQQFGNYQLVKLLGQGGQASVYLGKHRYLNSYAALKVLNTTIRSGDEHKFLAEAQTLVDLRHPNIVHLLDFAIESGTPVLIMDYAPNGSVRRHSPRGTQMPLTTVVDFVAQVAAALQYAHNHHIIHRDVKPENILLDVDNHLLLSDFGLSLLTPSSEQLSTQDPAGTARYMAPEQLRGKPGFASDQYALAVMVYEWLCGDPPFHGTLWEIWQQHMYTVPSPLRTVRPELPLMLEQVVQRALAKKPQDRFVSIQAFALALARASQISLSVDENDSQVTIPLQALPRSSPIAPPHQASALPSQRAQISIRAQVLDPPKLPPASTLQDQNRVRMLRRLRRSYSDLMSQSLQGAAWLELGIASKPDAVQNAAHLLLRVSNRTEELLPLDTAITEAYDEAEHELLILGEPGAGKSTLLLDLAERLLVRAEQDGRHPLPMILPLSSWAVKRAPLEEWIAEQVAEIYDVPRGLSMRWVQENGILPLLDGLDEMEEKARSDCITAINAYHRDHLAKLVVCSRTTEYEAAASHRRLALQGAVVVQPLTHEDVDAYLVRAGQPLAALRSALKRNSALQLLSTTPLMLNILILTYQGTSIGDLPSRESLLLRQVWDDYVQRMVTRKGDSKRYPLEQTRSYLGWLARQMRDHNRTVFYLEHLQPDWLSARQQRTYTGLAVRLPAIFIGALVSILVLLFFFGDTTVADFSSFLLYGLEGGLLGGIWRGPVSEKGKQGERRPVWGKRLVTRLAVSVCFGLISGLGLGLHLSSSFHYTLSQWQGYALFYAVVVGLNTLLLQYLLRAPFHLGVFTEKSAPQRWKRVVHFLETVQGLRALLVAVIKGLTYMLTIARFYGSNDALRLMLSFGLIYGLISLALSTQMEHIRPAERLKWSWRRLGRGLLSPGHLRITVLLTCIGVIFAWLGQGLSQGLSVGLSVGLSYWCLLGLFQGIAQEQIDDQDRRIANQGIQRSLHNSLIMGIIGGPIIGIIGILSYGLTLWLNVVLNNVLNNVLSYVLSYGQKTELISGLSSVVSYGLYLGISGTLLICTLTGGLAAWRHYVIRFLLWRSCIFPWQAPSFLSDATARFLLRRVGGGYSFTHRLLLDHFVDMETAMTLNANGPPTRSSRMGKETPMNYKV